ncbi:hypothetical protein V8G54_018237 [Vigna mungo]|uniref:Uncharacterized protein n=1 Tax=Vigna mungo TaxID=3915 RepID=A0AAQ3RUJ7_VIGMU
MEDFAGDNGGISDGRTVAARPLTQREKRDRRSDEGAHDGGATRSGGGGDTVDSLDEALEAAAVGRHQHRRRKREREEVIEEYGLSSTSQPVPKYTIYASVLEQPVRISLSKLQHCHRLSIYFGFMKTETSYTIHCLLRQGFLRCDNHLKFLASCLAVFFSVLDCVVDYFWACTPSFPSIVNLIC